MEHENYSHKINTEHEYSETPSDNGWSHLKAQAEERGLNIVGILSELELNKTKRNIIEKAIISHGLAWNDLLDYERTPRATETLRRMVAHWDTPIEDVPKTDLDHKEEAENFVELLVDEL